MNTVNTDQKMSNRGLTAVDVAYNKGLETAISLAQEAGGAAMEVLICGLRSSMKVSSVSAWWMFDNHTFQKIDITKPKEDWMDGVIECWNIDKCGCFFVRYPNGHETFSCHGKGSKESEEDFRARLAKFEADPEPKPKSMMTYQPTTTTP